MKTLVGMVVMVLCVIIMAFIAYPKTGFASCTSRYTVEYIEPYICGEELKYRKVVLENVKIKDPGQRKNPSSWLKIIWNRKEMVIKSDWFVITQTR